MLKEFSFGQFFPGNSLIHRADARMKIVLILAMIILIFFAANPFSLALMAIVVCLSFFCSRIPFISILRMLKGLLPIILITAILNAFYVKGTPIFPPIGFFTITYEGLYRAGFMAARIVLLLVITSLLTYTTSPIELTDALERLLSPLKKIRVPVHELAMIMTIALRFIPTLIEETDKIMSAQKARGADLESGGIFQRAKALIPILIPLFVSATRRAEELAIAMECRCYQGGQNRTRMKQMKTGKIDWFLLGGFCLLTALVFLLNFLFGNTVAFIV